MQGTNYALYATQRFELMETHTLCGRGLHRWVEDLWAQETTAG